MKELWSTFCANFNDGVPAILFFFLFLACMFRGQPIRDTGLCLALHLGYQARKELRDMSEAKKRR